MLLGVKPGAWIPLPEYREGLGVGLSPPEASLRKRTHPKPLTACREGKEMHYHFEAFAEVVPRTVPPPRIMRPAVAIGPANGVADPRPLRHAKADDDGRALGGGLDSRRTSRLYMLNFSHQWCGRESSFRLQPSRTRDHGRGAPPRKGDRGRDYR